MGEDPLRWGLMRLIEEIQGRSSTLALTSGLEGRPGSGHSMNSERYDAVCVEDLNMKGMSGGLHLGKGVQDNGYGQFLFMLGYKLEECGKHLIKVDRYFASSKICSVCGHKKKELALSDRMYVCGCGNRMDRDVNAAVNIREEGKRIYKECA